MQGPDELIWQGHPSWKGLGPWIARYLLFGLVLCILIVGLEALEQIPTLLAAFLCIVVVAAVFGLGQLKRKTTVYTISKHRVSEKSGIINIRKEQAQVEKITNITVTRNIFERILRIGKVNIDTANDTYDILDWWGVDNPYLIESLIDELRVEAADDDGLGESY